MNFVGDPISMGDVIPVDSGFHGLSIDDWTNNLGTDFFDSVKSLFGLDCGLSDSMIAESVVQASDFVNIDNPMEVAEGWTTGVYTGNPFTTSDDVLIFNRDQLFEMGLTEKDGLDLVMTHECAHRALQDHFDLNLSSHQEELCCDFVAGVRAGLNGIDVTQMEASLADSVASETHPAGELRVEAIEAGVAFAEDYMDKYGVAPTFNECVEHVIGNDSSVAALVNDGPGQITLREEQNNDFKGFINDKDWHLDEARKATERGDHKDARDHIRSAEMCSK